VLADRGKFPEYPACCGGAGREDRRHHRAPTTGVAGPRPSWRRLRPEPAPRSCLREAHRARRRGLSGCRCLPGHSPAGSPITEGRAARRVIGRSASRDPPPCAARMSARAPGGARPSGGHPRRRAGPGPGSCLRHPRRRGSHGRTVGGRVARPTACKARRYRPGGIAYGLRSSRSRVAGWPGGWPPSRRGAWVINFTNPAG